MPHLCKLILAAWLFPPAAAAVSPSPLAVTPAEAALVRQILHEVVAIDEEVASLEKYDAELNRSVEARNDEARSLAVRFPKLVLKPGASLAEMRAALRGLRAERAAVASPILGRQQAQAQATACDALLKLQQARANLEASAGYQRATLAERMKLREDLDAFITNGLKEAELDCR